MASNRKYVKKETGLKIFLKGIRIPHSRFYLVSFIILIVFSMTPPSSKAAEVSSWVEAVSEYVEEAVEELGIPGASLALVHNKEVVHIQAWGEAGGDRHEVTVQTPFLIGSISKSITSYGAMLLVQEEKIQLDVPVKEYLPWFTLKDSDAASQITVHHLLTHTSGISAKSGFNIADRGYHDNDAIRRVVTNLSSEKLTAQPGEEYQYSAANYAILGAVIESVSGISFAEYMEVYVFRPLRMDNASANIEQAKEKGWQPGYRSWFNIPIAGKAFYDNSGAPYGYIAASAKDMAHFLIALQEGESLSEENTEIMFHPSVQTSSISSYGYGWRVTPLEDGNTKIWHAGSTSDFRSEILMIPETEWGMVLLTNRNSPLEEANLMHVGLGITNILEGQDPEAIEASVSLERWILSGSFFLILILVSYTAFSLRKRRTIVKRRWLPKAGAWISTILAVMLVPSLLYFLQLPWHTFLLLIPDIALLSIGMSVLLGINGVILMINMYKGKSGRSWQKIIITMVRYKRVLLRD